MGLHHRPEGDIENVSRKGFHTANYNGGPVWGSPGISGRTLLTGAIAASLIALGVVSAVAQGHGTPAQQHRTLGQQ